MVAAHRRPHPMPQSLHVPRDPQKCCFAEGVEL
jgi:hypothetical protein